MEPRTPVPLGRGVSDCWQTEYYVEAVIYLEFLQGE